MSGSRVTKLNNLSQGDSFLIVSSGKKMIYDSLSECGKWITCITTEGSKVELSWLCEVEKVQDA